MHADRIRDVAQNQRSQRLHAVTKKSVLLTNNFSGDFEDCGGPLVQRLDQPIRGVQPLGQVVFLGLAACCLAYPRAIPAIDQDARQGIRVELDNPATVGLCAHQDVGHDRLGERWIESEPRSWIERFDLGDHIGHIRRVDPAHPNQRSDIAGGKQRQVVEQNLHCGIEAIPVAQL